MERNFILRISLSEIQPLIWRQVRVNADISLSELHHVIQLAMGWKNYHLYQFFYHNLLMGNSVLLDEKDIINDRLVTLASILKGEGDVLGYEYDFGDGWMHEIRLETITNEAEASYPPVCLNGERNSPPEDCGGVGGYYSLLKALSDKRDPEHKEILQWAGTYDPEKINLDAINKSFRSIQRYIRKYETENGL